MPLENQPKKKELPKIKSKIIQVLRSLGLDPKEDATGFNKLKEIVNIKRTSDYTDRLVQNLNENINKSDKYRLPTIVNAWEQLQKETDLYQREKVLEEFKNKYSKEVSDYIITRMKNITDMSDHAPIPEIINTFKGLSNFYAKTLEKTRGIMKEDDRNNTLAELRKNNQTIKNNAKEEVKIVAQEIIAKENPNRTHIEICLSYFSSLEREGLISEEDTEISTLWTKIIKLSTSTLGTPSSS